MINTIMKKLLPIFIVAILVAGGGAFYGGMKYAESTRQNFARQNLGGQNLQNLSPEERQQRLQELSANAGTGFRGGRARGQAGGGFTFGEIISKDDKSITIKFRDGGSKIVFLSDSTEITKSASGSINDLEVGKNISVNGTANSDGSITAQSIQSRP